MGWTYESMYYTPPVYFFAAVESYLKHEDKKERSLYGIIRVHAAVILNSFSKKSIQPESIMKFRWDKADQEADQKTKEQRNKILKMWAANPPRRAGESPTARIKM